ncbi:hypothetical protein CTS44_16378 [Comamonas thiooxydans]|nr:hypothetical protein CTS44_16378 [Comamonas thiooxydans]
MKSSLYLKKVIYRFFAFSEFMRYQFQIFIFIENIY